MTARLTIFGCGYVGSAVASAALARKWSVTALTRNEAQAEMLRARGVHVVVADLADTSWHAAISREQDFVLNSVSSGGGGLAGYRRSYVEGTRSILSWAAGGVPATFVYTSSTSVYPQSGGEVVTEDSPVGKGGSEAAVPLLEAERMVQGSCAFDRWFVLRLAGIYGPGRHYLLDQLRAGAMVFPGTGTHRLNLIHRDDIVSAILACFDAPHTVRDTFFNVAGDRAEPKATLANWLAAETGCPHPRFAADEDVTPAILPGGRGRSGPVPDRVISNERLKAVLGWCPRYPEFRVGYRHIFATEQSGSPAIPEIGHGSTPSIGAV